MRQGRIGNDDPLSEIIVLVLYRIAPLAACGLARQSPTFGHLKPEKIFVEIGPVVVLTYALKCPLGVSWPA